MNIIRVNPNAIHLDEWQQNLVIIEQAIRQLDLTYALAWTEPQAAFESVFRRLQVICPDDNNQTHQPR